MPRKTATTKELAALISQLREERQQHLDAIAEIDATFKRFGIVTAPAKRRGRPRQGVKRLGRPRKKAARRRFAVSGPASILALVKGKGAKGATSAEINRKWKKDGRSGSVYVTLSHLVKAKKLKKQKVKGGRGSRYTAA